MALVEVEVIDVNGLRVPDAMHMIHYTMEGPAEWRGGMAQGPENYILAHSFPVETGVNRFLIRSTTTPGKIKIKARADGLKEAVIMLTTKPSFKANGLSTILPASQCF